MPSIWQGEHVRLRAVEPFDWEVFFRWNRDDEQARRLDFIRFPQSAEATRRWVEERARTRPETDTYTLVMENEAGAVAGGIATHDCDRRTGTFAYGLNVLEEYRGQGYASDVVRILLRAMFRELRYQKCTVQVYDFNDASIRLHERLGFRQEGRLRRMGFTDGRHFDVFVYGITAEEFTATDQGRG
jgi:RimJ/RimL family protein N-acetyltransferase